MNNSEIFIVGARGQLGLALQAQYPGARTADIDELNITDIHSVTAFDWTGTKVILNAAAYTNVDGAETDEGRLAAWNVNASAVANLVRISLANDILLVHVSSDYVFDGTKVPHNEDELLSPLSVYGQAKAAGDVVTGVLPKHYLIRSTWIIGEGNNFVRTMMGLGKKGVSPTVVADQIGRLTFTSELVRAVDHLLTTRAAYGTYNVTNSGEPESWANITRVIFELSKYDLAVTDTSTADYYAGKEGIAPRPLNSIMNLEKLEKTGFVSRDWHDDLKDYIEKELSV